MSNLPDYRWKLLNRGTKGADSIVDSLLDNPMPELLSAVSEISRDKVQKLYVESSLLASNDLTVISKFLEVELCILEMYRTLCYDITSMSKLQKLAHLERIKDSGEKNMKNWALLMGIKFLEWRFGNEVTISPVEGLTRIFADSYYKSKEAFFNGNSTEASKESAKWTKIAMESGKQLKQWVTDSDEAMKDIQIALEKYTGDIEFPTLDDLEE